MILVMIARAVGYDFGTVIGYLAYVAAYVALPGIVLTRAIHRGPLSLTTLLALGLPAGFAAEIFTFLGLSALQAKWLYPIAPVGWAALAALVRLRTGNWPVRVRVAGNHAGLFVGLVIAFLCTAVMATSQMFVEAPLADGLPTRAIFHDWVYLVSRAGAIKNHWPLDDPSLSGTPLQYHYFMMVHAAAASWTTHIELSTVMLRLIFVPLGAVLVAQAYALGRAVARTPWGGIIAALLTVVVSEVSFAPSYGDPMFLGLFVRWLFVSPTFFFGMIFCGALLLAIAHCLRLERWTWRHVLWLLLLGTAGTGAKGTLVPVIGCALGIWCGWQTWRRRRLPLRGIVIGVCLVAAFAAVYVPTMSAWRTGDAAWRPFHVFQLAGFWKQYLAPWTQGLAQWLPAGIAGPVAALGCAVVVFAGTCGVRLLAIPFLFWGDSKKGDSLLVSWLGAFFCASIAMGALMELNSYGELYVILMMRLPMAVLTAAFLVEAVRRMRTWWREWEASPATATRLPFASRSNGAIASRQPPVFWLPRVLVGGGALVLIFSLGVQTSLWWARNRVGLRDWWQTPPRVKPDDYMQGLREGLLWVRENTEADAVLVANACTPENMKKDHWGALDGTLMGVHFYYSALSERRLWFEGPNYIMDTTRARIRANLASNFFYRGGPLEPAVVNSGPCYVLVDRSLADGAKVALDPAKRVFSNRRMDIYRLSEFMTGD